MSNEPVHTVLWRECGKCGWTASQKLRIINADVDFKGDGVKTLTFVGTIRHSDEMNIRKFTEEHKCGDK